MSSNKPLPVYTLEEIQILAGYFKGMVMVLKPGTSLSSRCFESLDVFYRFLQEDKWRAAPFRIPFKKLPLHINKAEAYIYWTNSVVNWRLQIGK